MQITLDVLSDGEISFYYKVSSEANYDFLRFYLDGDEQSNWSGNSNWTEVNFPVSAGNRTFEWVYEKDGSVSSGSDCAWIDYIIFPATEQPIIYGDVDGNGQVQAMDASLTLQNVVDMINFEEWQILAGDVDGNGQIQAMDASYILQFVVGMIDNFPIENGRIKKKNRRNK